MEWVCNGWNLRLIIWGGAEEEIYYGFWVLNSGKEKEEG